jgi:hypothetical protein
MFQGTATPRGRGGGGHLGALEVPGWVYVSARPDFKCSPNILPTLKTVSVSSLLHSNKVPFYLLQLASRIKFFSKNFLLPEAAGLKGQRTSRIMKNQCYHYYLQVY